MKVLIVDDNPYARRMVKLHLYELADEVRECSDGSEALAAYREFQPDWVVMDWAMKLMDGLTATQQIMAEYPEAHILICTQHDDLELRAAAGEIGVCGFVLKDDLMALRMLLRTYLINK